MPVWISGERDPHAESNSQRLLQFDEDFFPVQDPGRDKIDADKKQSIQEAGQSRIKPDMTHSLYGCFVERGTIKFCFVKKESPDIRQKINGDRIGSEYDYGKGAARMASDVYQDCLLYTPPSPRDR